MAKTTKQGFSLHGFDAAHYAQTEQYTQAIDALYAQAVSEYAKLATSSKISPDKLFSFSDYPATKAKAEAIVNGLAANMKAVVTKGSSDQWLYACKKNDAFLESIIDTSKVPKATLAKFQDKNLDALKTFQTRKVNGMDLSDRIWNYTGQMKTQMELGIDIALGDGRSAQALSRDLREYLVDPDKLFRRVRDKHGNLVLSKAAKAFHPGQGKYRSSYKNAMRLTRSEINMAYRESDQLRWEQLDFVVGFEVKTSNNHPIFDICDHLKGKYPKDFKFKGWHPQCRCHAIPVMEDPSEFNTNELNELKSAINGTEYQKLVSKNAVSDVPTGFKDWIKENTERSKGWKSQPYFIKDNFAGGSIAGGLKVATKSAEVLAVAEAAKVAEEIAAKAKALLDKTTKMSENLIIKAEKLGYSGPELDDLKALLTKEGVTNAELNSVYKKLNVQYKALVEANKDPFSKAALLSKYSKEEVDSLFNAYDNFYKAKLNSLDVSSKISKLEFEVNWLATNGKYSTSGVLKEMLQRDLLILKNELQIKLEQQAFASTIEKAKDVISSVATIDYKAVKKATEELTKAIENKTVTIEIINAKTAKVNDALAEYYTKQNAKLSKIKPDWSKAAYTQKRKDDALWAKDAAESDKKLRDNCGKVWAGATDAEKDAAYYYTHTYSSINEPLRGVSYYGNKSVSTSQSKVPHLTSIIDKSKYDFDMWVQRGVESPGVEGLFGVDLNSISKSELNTLVGKVGHEKGFSSCGVSKGKGFSHKPIIYNIYCPKGTKMMYLEPFSAFGEGARGVNWNGISKQMSFSSESEVLLQRDTMFRITKVEYKGGKYYIDMDIISQ